MKKKILLVEPGYKNKYPPLGLMKIASYHRTRGDNVRFVKGEDASIFGERWDRVYVTSLFSFEWKKTAKAIDYAIKAAGNQAERVFAGGISVSLMKEAYEEVPEWAGVRFVQGILDGAPAKALQLSADKGDFGLEDVSGTSIEDYVPDYRILDDTDYQYKVHDAYFGYASRGCVRKCHFCGVPKLEGAQRKGSSLTALVEGVRQVSGEKRDLLLMDNNVTAAPNYSEIIAEIRDLGFHKGAKLSRDGKPPVKRRVDFNQGVDARILVKSPHYLQEMATICVSPLRIAFDHVGMHKIYERAVRMAQDNGISALSNYMLYNFMDSPEDLYRRMQLNIRLNGELNVRIWSFPMRYQPVTQKDRSNIGPRWNRYVLRSFQVMLQATHGVVSGSSGFFNHAYGDSMEKFMWLLNMPHHFIFHRKWFHEGEGRGVLDDYTTLMKRMSESQIKDLQTVLSDKDRGFRGNGLKKPTYEILQDDSTIDPLIRKALWYYVAEHVPLPPERSKNSTVSSSVLGKLSQDYDPALSSDKKVEDAGLYDTDEEQDLSEVETTAKQKRA